MRTIALRGATGRLGLAIADAVTTASDLRLGSVLASTESERRGMVVAGLPVETRPSVAFDVLVEATVPAALDTLIELVAETDAGLVVATTGYDEEAMSRLRELGLDRAVVIAPNLATGVSALAAIIPRLAEWLCEYDVELVEMHHREKRDAPSGTASMWLDCVRESRPDLVEVQGRGGGTQPRRSREIGVHSLRGGGVVGEHRLIFAGNGERVEIVHRAEDRRAFGEGAVRAARFAAEAPPGVYGMREVIKDLLARR